MKSQGAVGLALCTLLVLNLQAQVIFEEDFEAGSLTNWTTVGSALTITSTNNIVPSGGTYSAIQTSSGNRMYRNLLTNVSPTTRMTFYLWDDGDVNGKSIGDVRVYSGGSYGSGGLTQILGAGKTILLDPGLMMNGAAESINTNKYQARIGTLAFNVTSAGYFNLNGPGSPNRSPGWHRFDIERGPHALDDSVILNYYVDGTLSRSFTNTTTAWTNHFWNVVVIGFGAVAAQQGSHFDGIRVVAGQPFIQLQPANQTLATGELLMLSVTAVSGSSQTYQWIKDGSAITGATSSSYAVPAAVTSDSGSYTVVVSNAVDYTESVPAQVIVHPAIRITSHPQSGIINLGASAFLSVDATGDGTLAYQWFFNSTNNPIPGATAAMLTITNVGFDNAGNYFVVVSDSMGNPPQTSLSANVVVNGPPEIQNTNTSIIFGQSLPLKIIVSDDMSSAGTTLADFERYVPGAKALFNSPGFSSSGNIDGSLTNFSYVSDTFPAGLGGRNVLHSQFGFDPGPWIRLSTYSGTVFPGSITNQGNPIISFSLGLSFDIFCNQPIKIALGVRETNPSGEYGEDGGTTPSVIELVGVNSGGFASPDPIRQLTPGVWTNLYFDLPNEAVANGSSGNGVLNSTTGKGVLEMLCLSRVTNGVHNLYFDNLSIVPTNTLTFRLVSGPSDAAINRHAGELSWAPPDPGTYEFGIAVTDHHGLSTTNIVTVTVHAAPSVTISRLSNDVVLTWAEPFILQASPTLTNQFIDVPDATSPFTNPISGGAFFRLRD